MNKKILLIVVALSCVVKANSQQTGFQENVYKFLEDPGMFAINQEPGHVPLVPFTGIEEALENKWAESWGYFSLDGQWKFKWSENPDGCPKDFFQQNFNDQMWDSIKVPGNWEMHGYGQAMFRNTVQPFHADPPNIPHDYNPVGSYRKSFQLPSSWKDKQIFLHMEAATSATFVWVNGKEAGFNEGANEPAEYNITRYVKPGINVIAVNVYKYSAGTYLEAQDFWRLAGIFRNVYLLATHDVHIRDFFVTTDLDEDYRDARLTISADIKNYADRPVQDYSVRISLFDKNRKQKGNTITADKIFVSGKESKSTVVSARVINPDKWSAEFPNLYYLIFELLGPDHKVVEVLSNRIGFKKVEVKHQALYVNGAPVKLNGVNSHMQHPETGHAMDVETLHKDMVLMKQFNINCIRTSHYPPNREYLDLADELGMYIVDETGDEAHATEYISESPKWTAAYVDRVRGMVLRDRNHPCIIFWSAGNESGFGDNICKVIQEGKRLDPTRLFMYGGNTDDVGWKNEVPCEDIIGPRYATPYELKTRIAEVPESQDARPSFMDEYISVAGNGGGGLDEYWDIINNYPRCIGGALWDWVSPGIREKIIALSDASGNHIHTTIQGGGRLTDGKSGKAVDLSGHDQWVDVYRHPALDITGDQLTLSLWVYPRSWNTDGTYITKGSYQYGLVQNPRDSLRFYIAGNKQVSLSVLIPPNWENNWHHLAGIYNGKNLAIYIDGKCAGTKPGSIRITNKPFPVNIGRNAELVQQEYTGNTSNALFDQVAIFNKAIAIEQLINPSQALKNEALLWLDFDDLQEQGDYFSLGLGARSYGLIFPDREIQPELWQVKKSAQPVHVDLIDPIKGIIKIWNRYQFSNLSDLKTTWYILADDKVIQQGNLKISVGPSQQIETAIPYKKPDILPDTEYRLLVNFTLKESNSWAPQNFEIAWDQMELPWDKSSGDIKVQNAPKVSMAETSSTILVSGLNFTYTFNKTTGRIDSMNYMGRQLLREGPKLNVWRAPLANEQDPWSLRMSQLTFRKQGMGDGPSNTWYSFGLDHLSFKVDHISYVEDKNNTVKIIVEDHAEGSDYRTAFYNHYEYIINGFGEVSINHIITPLGLMPEWIPRMGIQLIINKEFETVKWYGRGPFENYPDRKTGAKIGIYKSTVQDMKEKYLIPQDYGLRTDIRWVRLENSEGYGLDFKGDKLFNFSVQPYETDNLTRASYPYQLQPFDGLTFNLDYATSGVGCTAISVLNQYRVLPQVYKFTVRLIPYKNDH
jgi:beta-galactosidase